jgi:hypothetical protein
MIGACVAVVFVLFVCVVIAFVAVVVAACKMWQRLKERKAHTHGHKQHTYSTYM